MKIFKTTILIVNFLICLSLLLSGIGRYSSVSNLFLLSSFFGICAYFALSIIPQKIILKIKKIVYLKNFLLVYSFIFLTVLVFANFSNRKGITDLLYVAIFVPLYGYFIYEITSRFKKTVHVVKQMEIEKEQEIKIEQKAKNYTPIDTTSEDIDRRRRQFIKILSGTSIGLFALYLFNNPKKVGAAFFGSVPGPGTIAVKDSLGKKIDPAISSPLDGYGITNIYDANYPYYFGFVNKNSNWYILKIDSDENFRYIKGDSGFASNWSNKGNLGYDYFDQIFKPT